VSRLNQDKVNPAEFIQLLRELQHREEARRKTSHGAVLDPRLAMLRRWQSERLAQTYADLLANEQYRAACLFFLSDIYSSRDFSQRDQDAEHLYSLLSRFLPEAMLRLLADTIRINQLTNQLDQALLKVLVEDLSMTDAITPQLYAQAYRLCDNYSERRKQIELLVKILREAATGARNPIFAVSLHLAGPPARRAGWGELYDFLKRGYAACKPMRDVDYFVATIYQREMDLLDRIYAGDAEPFKFSRASY
jgi:hypothetical protein